MAKLIKFSYQYLNRKYSYFYGNEAQLFAPNNSHLIHLILRATYKVSSIPRCIINDASDTCKDRSGIYGLSHSLLHYRVIF